MTTQWRDVIAFLDEIRVKARSHKPKEEVDPQDSLLTVLQGAVEQLKAGKFDYHAPVEETPLLQATTTGVARVKTVEESERPFRGNTPEPRMTVQPRENKPVPQKPDLEEVIDDALAATLPPEEEPR